MNRDESRAIDDICYEIWKELNGIWGNAKRRRNIHMYLNTIRSIAKRREESVDDQ